MSFSASSSSSRLRANGRGMAPGLAIRTAEGRDLGRLARMVRQHIERQHELADGAFELEPEIDWRRLASSRLERENACLFVAEVDGRLVGYVDARLIGAAVATKRSLRRSIRSLLQVSSAREPARIVRRRCLGVIEEVYVEPEERRRGVALELAGAAIDWLEAAGAGDIEVSVWAANQASQSLASKLGFRPARLVLRRPSSDRE